MNQNIDNDELEDLIMRPPTPRERETGDHDMMFKALSNPVRRRIIAFVGAFGKSSPEIEIELSIDKFLLKYHLDFLQEGGYVISDGETYRLTDKGLGLLSNI